MKQGRRVIRRFLKQAKIWDDPIVRKHTNCVCFAMRDLLGVLIRGAFLSVRVIPAILEQRQVKTPKDGDIVVWYNKDCGEDGGNFHMGIVCNGLCYSKEGLGEDAKYAAAPLWMVDKYERKHFTHFKRVRHLKLPIKKDSRVQSALKKIRWALRQKNYDKIIGYIHRIDARMVKEGRYIPKGQKRSETKIKDKQE